MNPVFLHLGGIKLAGHPRRSGRPFVPGRRSALVSIAATAAIALALAPSAFAHSAFLGSTPEPGTRLGAAPAEIRLTFTERLNTRLSTARLLAARGGAAVDAARDVQHGRALVLTPARRLPRGAYRVEWHTVSSEDGHALEGSFSFGVRAAAVGGAHEVDESPLARGGLARVAARAVFYPVLLLFVGALVLWVLLPPMGAGGSWLVPPAVARVIGDDEAARLARRERDLTRDVGLAAAALCVVVVVLEAADAAGGLSFRGLQDYLLTSVAGRARTGEVLLVMGAALLAGVLPRIAAVLGAGALATLALSGHANSVSPRALAVATDWVHLLAGAVWLGGIALFVVVWGRGIWRRASEERLAVVRYVLPRFGRVALPSFIAVVAAGTLNGVLEVGSVSELFTTGYGKVLLVKINLVVLLAAASYSHVYRLRPRLLGANPHPAVGLERRHWRLLRAEPLLGVAVLAAAATLVAFPLPPRQLLDGDAARAAVPACDPCPLPRPRANELAVAAQGGTNVVAAWVRRSGGRLEGEVRLIGVDGKPSRDRFRILRGARQRTCGPGCRRFTLEHAPPELLVAVAQRGRRYVAHLPARWQRDGGRRARELLVAAQATMRRLRSAREVEQVSTVPETIVTTTYELQAPDRFRYTIDNGQASVVIGRRQWQRSGSGPWRAGGFGAGVPFRTRSWFRWTPYAIEVRLLGVRRRAGRRVAEVAAMDPGTPVWTRLWIDLATTRVVQERLTTKGAFWFDRYGRFDAPLNIRRPRGAADAG